MPTITISLDEDVRKVLDKRAKKSFLTLRELIEDIVRRSAVHTSSSSGVKDIKCDDQLVGIFSRAKSGRKKKTIKKKSKKK